MKAFLVRRSAACPVKKWFVFEEQRMLLSKPVVTADSLEELNLKLAAFGRRLGRLVETVPSAGVVVYDVDRTGGDE